MLQQPKIQIEGDLIIRHNTTLSPVHSGGFFDRIYELADGFCPNIYADSRPFLFNNTWEEADVELLCNLQYQLHSLATADRYRKPHSNLHGEESFLWP